MCITCVLKRLPNDRAFEAALHAININPANRPPVEHAAGLAAAGVTQKGFLAVLTAKKWMSNGVNLTVGFVDDPPVDLRARIVSHMNAWSKTAKVKFVETMGEADVRIARAADGYWSYLGTDILLIDADKPTMNLQDFTMNTPDAEFYRVVRHETGHTLGFPHEHMRQELVDLIDPEKCIEYFNQAYGWSEEEVRQQVLTPIEASSLLGTARADSSSIMCYQIPGALTKAGKAIPGGLDIDAIDYDFAGKVYPK